ncbi:hypothetical protein [Undibacterium sp. TS12]|uniref:hypothetical protein n=1 Tax=Undibacterium sp. TS12 TaxID=2908202 RepID=UPI001F4C9C02|nr:hypothetical protein [Undibacterium sp. TS12]MCH8621765.1 hypothetical protein [Undibacterium sp. TS12]
MSDPITIAAITAAVSVLGNEYIKGVASEAGKTTWQGIKSLFGWSSDPAPSEVATQVATKLTASPELLQQVLELLQKDKETGAAASMVGTINAAKVVVANTIVTQHFQM